MSRSVLFLFFCIFLFTISNVSAYVGNTGRLGTIDINLRQPPTIDGLDKPVGVVTTLKNTGDAEQTVTLLYSTIETIRFPESEAVDKRELRKTVTVPVGASINVTVKILALHGTYNAHYPIRLDATLGDETLHVVHPVRTEVGPNPNWPKKLGFLDAVTKSWPKWNDVERSKPIVFELGENRRCEVAPGPLGLVDAVISLFDGETKTVIHGLRVWVAGRPLPEVVTTPMQRTEPNRWMQEIELDGQKAQIHFGISRREETVRFSVSSSVPGFLTRIEFGPTDTLVDRVYFGHGYIVDKPGNFSVGPGGHHLSTSHVGFDFENGLSLLMATTAPPEGLTVNHASKMYTVHTRDNTALSLLVGNRAKGGALDCAVRYRKYTEKKPAPGSATKAGRFVVDIWNGLYREHAELIRRCAEYGLKDDLIFLSHNWQRYKYDHRLPDVWPPNPEFGTKKDMQEAMRTAHDNGWLFGVHMNVIDYYPDSSVFTFDDVVFNRDGNPRKAYLNVMLDAQSYQLRPDRAAAVLDESMKDMLREFPLSAGFVDVLASNQPTLFYDRHGNFHSREEANRGRAEVFNLLRQRMNAPTEADEKLVGKRPVDSERKIVFPTISEAGHDFLAGSLDGADCQFMYLTNTRGENRWLIVPKYDDWERIPWFDAVNHVHFPLHGVGYSIRYEGGRGRELHGIDSDDYICSEILTGHAPMTDGACRDVKEILGGTIRNMDVAEALRSTVRKYRLAWPVSKSLAAANIESVEFVDGNIHRQKIRWSDGTVIHVNRGESDWTVDDVTLPRYGYRAKNERTGLDSAICRLDGKVVERTYTKEGNRSTWYVNGRGTPMPQLVPATPSVTKFEHLDGSRFRSALNFSVLADMPTKNYRLKLHLVKRKSTEAGSGPDAELGFLTPERPVSQWKNGENIPAAPAEFSVPDDFPKGEYDLLISADDVEDSGDVHKRGKFFATPSFWRRYHLGRLTVDRDADGVKSMAFDPAPNEDAPLYGRLVPPEQPVDFGVCRTTAGLVIETEADRITVTPLPSERAATVELRPPGVTPKTVRGEVLDASGQPLRPLAVRIESQKIVFETAEGDFAYRLSFGLY